MDENKFKAKPRPCIAGGIASCYSHEMGVLANKEIPSIKEIAEIHNEKYWDYKNLRKVIQKLKASKPHDQSYISALDDLWEKLKS